MPSRRKLSFESSRGSFRKETRSSTTPEPPAVAKEATSLGPDEDAPVFISSIGPGSTQYYVDYDTSSTISRSDSVCSCLSCCGGPGPGGLPFRRTSVVHDGEREGVSVRDAYKFDAILGEGTFSVVYLAERISDPDGLVAIKVVERHSPVRDAGDDAPTDISWIIEKELSIMSKLDHPHIVHLNEVYHEPDDNTVCFVMELAKGGEVFDRLLEQGAFTETQASVIVVQLLCAVNYLHEQGIVHRDLKLENLLFYDDAEDSKILVADFGLSEYVWEIQEDSPLCGTPGYMAPEVIAERHVSPAADVWSIGVITYLLLAGYPPFCPQRNREEGNRNNGDSGSSENPSDNEEEDNEEAHLLKLIVEGKFEFHSHSWRHISEEAKDFIRRLMCLGRIHYYKSNYAHLFDPNERLTCAQALEHPWLSSSQRGGTRTIAPATPGEERKRRVTRNAFLRCLLLLVVVYAVIVSYLFSLDLISSCLPITSAILSYVYNSEIQVDAPGAIISLAKSLM